MANILKAVSLVLGMAVSGYSASSHAVENMIVEGHGECAGQDTVLMNKKVQKRILPRKCFGLRTEDRSQCVELGAPNPDGKFVAKPEVIVLTHTVHSLKDSIKCFKEEPASLHILIEKDGSIIQCVPLSRCAWGCCETVLSEKVKKNDPELEGLIKRFARSSRKDDTSPNPNIGFVEGYEGCKTYTDEQYATGKDLVKALRIAYKIEGKRVLTITEISGRLFENTMLDFDKSRVTENPKVLKAEPVSK